MKTDLPSMATVCDNCLSRPQKTTFGISVFCKHNSTGAVMEFQNGEPIGTWYVMTPTTEQQFAGFLCSMRNLKEKSNHG